MILDKPVKTYLMAAIQNAMNGIAEIAQKPVKYGQGIPTDQDTAVYPWCCFFDEKQSKTRRNRIEITNFELVIQVWVKESDAVDVEDMLDLLDAKVEAAILTDAGIRQYVMPGLRGEEPVDPLSSDKLFPDMQTGILQAVYRITYGHAWANPFDTGT